MTSPLVCDTSGLLAAFDRKHPLHREAAAALETEPGSRLVSPLILVELDYLLLDRFGVTAARTFYADLQAAAYDVAELTRKDIHDTIDVADRHADMGLGLADASNVVVAAKYRTVRLLSLDETHMRAVRPLDHGSAFMLLPIDLA